MKSCKLRFWLQASDIRLQACGLWLVACSLICLLLPYTAYCFTLNDAQKDYLYGNYEEAIRKAQSLKHDDQTLYFLGLAYTKIGAYSKAQGHLNKLIQRFPHSRFHSQGLVKLADTYFLQKDYLRAKSLYLEIIKKYPSLDNMPIVYLRLVQIASRQGNWDKKQEYLHIIKTKYPQSSEMKFVRILEGYGDFFTIQVGAFSEKKNAFVLREELSKDYNVYIVEDTKGNYPIYKVRVGKFKNRYDVEKAAAQLLNKGYPARIYP